MKSRARNRLACTAIGALFGVSLASSGHAAVIESDAQGFAIEETAHIAATPDAVYAALITPGKWWNAEHTYSGRAANLTLDAHAGGCLCERLPDGGSVKHQEVAFASPGKILRLRGAMGPFEGQGVDGAMTFTLKPANGGTDLVLDDNIGGYVKGGFGKLPDAADGMLTDLVAHLKFFVEKGEAMPPAQPNG